MAAYVIVEIEITDAARYEEYRRLAAHSVAAHGGRYLVRGGPAEIFEGEWVPKRIVVLEFPTLEQAREWWASDEYRPARAIRETAANVDMIAVPGV